MQVGEGLQVVAQKSALCLQLGEGFAELRRVFVQLLLLCPPMKFVALANREANI